MRLITADEAEELAGHIEAMFADITELRGLRAELVGAGGPEMLNGPTGQHTYIPQARVALLGLLSKARGGDLVGDTTAVCITLRDEEDGEVNLVMEFDPPMTNPFKGEGADELTPAQVMAGSMVAYAFEKNGITMPTDQPEGE